MQILLKTAITVLAAASTTLSAAVPLDVRAVCTPAKRIEGAKAVPFAYNQHSPGASAAAAEKVPFGPDCSIVIYPNGSPIGAPTAFNEGSCRAFLIETRQAFSHVTGRYTDFKNATTLIDTNVTLGVRDIVPIPVTFHGYVYLVYDKATCLISQVIAYAQVPSEVLGKVIDLPGIPSLGGKRSSYRSRK